MEILATAQLIYHDGEAITAGWERLSLEVKFKEHKKLFKTKLNKTLVSTNQVLNHHLTMNPLNTFDDYFNECEKYINDNYLVKKAAENMIKDYFKDKSKEEKRDSRSKNIEKRVNKLGKIEIKVTVE